MEKLKSNVFKTKHQSEYCIVKIYTKKTHIWNGLPSFKKVNELQLLSRISHFYDKMDELGFGPKIYKKKIENNKLYISMEYFPTKVYINYIENNKDYVTQFISKLHNAGYIHGDIINNLMLNSLNELRIIDFETMFIPDEKDNNVIKEHYSSVGYTVDELIELETACVQY